MSIEEEKDFNSDVNYSSEQEYSNIIYNKS